MGLTSSLKKNDKYKLIKIKEYINAKYDFRYNLFAKKPEWRLKDEKDFEYFEERDFDNLFNEITIDAGHTIGQSRLQSLVGSNKISVDYDPIKEYLFSLPKWDGKDRFPYFLAQIKLKRETEQERLFLEKYFKKWFVTLVASLIDVDVINEVAPIFTGEEGRGKTRFFISLVPYDLRLKYFYSGTFNPHDKDHREMLGTKILIFWDEMASYNRTDVETLKTTMSERYTVLRRAYGRGNIHLYRRASFAGAINDERFLTDTGANRRWLPFAVESIDIDEEFNIDLLYAQAIEIFRSRKENGFELYYDRGEIDQFKERNEYFRRLAPEEELIQLHYCIPSEDEIASEKPYLKYLTPTDVMYSLSSMDQYKKMNANDSVARRIGKILTSMGFPAKQMRLPGVKNPRHVYVMKVNKTDSYDIKEGRAVNVVDDNYSGPVQEDII